MTELTSLIVVQEDEKGNFTQSANQGLTGFEDESGALAIMIV